MDDIKGSDMVYELLAKALLSEENIQYVTFFCCDYKIGVWEPREQK